MSAVVCECEWWMVNGWVAGIRVGGWYTGVYVTHVWVSEMVNVRACVRVFSSV
jgi:hypothetical protein